jgi:hypothetical protein
MAKQTVSKSSATYRVTIEGEVPMLMNRCELIQPKSGGPGKPPRDPDKLLNEWRGKAYFSEDIGVYIPSDYIEGAIKEAAANWRMKKTAAAALFCTEDRSALKVKGIPQFESLDDFETHGWIDRRNVKMKASGGSTVMRCRPLIPSGWKATFELWCAAPLEFTPELLLEILQVAGQFKGIGDYRPKYGRFAVTEFKGVK